MMNFNMRILHVLDVSAPTLAGYASRSRAIVNAQRALGLEPVVLTSARHRNDSGVALEEIDGIKHYRTLKPAPSGRNPLTEMIGLRQRIIEVARMERVDLIHAHSPILAGLPGARPGCFGAGAGATRPRAARRAIAARSTRRTGTSTWASGSSSVPRPASKVRTERSPERRPMGAGAERPPIVPEGPANLSGGR